MKVGKVTSAVEGVGSSRRENTPTKGRLESLSIHVCRKCTLQTIFQVYAPLQTYVNEDVLCQKTDQWAQYGSKENWDVTLNWEEVEHLKQEVTRKVQGSIALSHLIYVLQIDTWWSREFASTSVPIGFEEVRN